MSVGNLKDYGNKGNNFPYQLGVLSLLEQIANNGGGGGGGCCPTAATEATLQAVLVALQSGQAFIQSLITDDTGATYSEVKIWNGSSFDPPVYYDANGNVVSPVPPLQYVNPEYVLNNILLQETAIRANTNNLDVALSTRATEATQVTVKNTLVSKLDVALSTLATQATASAMSGTLTSIYNNSLSKINRIKGAADYTRAFTYLGSTNNVGTITHTGTTALGAETIVETFSYVNPTVDGSNVTGIVYS